MSKRMALLVGINEYTENSHLKTLNFAENDVKLMDETLKKYCDFSLIKSITGKEAQFPTIRDELETFYNEDDLDLFLFYFSGHGEFITSEKMHCLHCFKSQAGFHDMAINLREWSRRLIENIKAKNILIIADACRNGLYSDDYGIKSAYEGLNPSVIPMMKDFSGYIGKNNNAHSKALFTFLSCGTHQVSFEDSSLKHGIFTYSLVNKIKKKGDQLHIGFLSEEIRRDTIEHCIQNNYTPTQKPELIEPPTNSKIFLGSNPPKYRKLENPKLPDEDAILGKAVSDIIKATPSPYGTRGLIRRYQTGSIYYIEKPGNPLLNSTVIKTGDSFRVNDFPPFNTFFNLINNTQSKLGFPVSEMNKTWDSCQQKWSSHGYIQIFEGGNLYFCERYGVHSLLEGKIRELFISSEKKVTSKNQQNITGGEFGFPISEPQEIVSHSGAKGMMQRFEFGAIIEWAGKAYGIINGFHDLYQSMGEWRSHLGFPLSDEKDCTSRVSNTLGSIQKFENGSMLWNNRNDKCYYLFGKIHELWVQDESKYGFPITNPYNLEDRVEQQFEGGVLSMELEEKTNFEEFHKNPKPSPHNEKEDIKQSPPVISPDRILFSKEQNENIRMIHQIFAVNYSTLLSNYLNTTIQIDINSVTASNFDQFVPELPDPTFYTIISIENNDSNFLIEINPSILLPLIDKILGKKHDNIDLQLKTRNVTDIENTLINGIFELGMRELEKAWTPYFSKTNMKIFSSGRIPNNIINFKASEEVVSIAFELRETERKGFIHLCIPLKLARQLIDKM